MKYLLILPPVTFIIIVLFSYAMSFISSKLALKSNNNPEGKFKPYACGEDLPSPHVQPDYSQFFPFAFFFTIMHVFALIITTAPASAMLFSGNAYLYVLCAGCALLILFRK